jgi:hypothetical protein
MATLHLSLPDRLKAEAEARAAAAGCESLDDYIAGLIEADKLLALGAQTGVAPVSSTRARELELLAKVNIGLSDDEWRRYRALSSKLENDALSTEERAELLQTSDRVERANADRMKHLIELAEVRKIPLEQLMDQLGLGNGREAGGGLNGD